jgi:hypothetical protein
MLAKVRRARKRVQRVMGDACTISPVFAHTEAGPFRISTMRSPLSCSGLATALLCGFALACDHSTSPALTELPPATPNADGAVTYFAAKTVERQGSAKQVVEFTLDERDHSLFMEPFVLHVQQTGERALRATVRVDGLPVLVRGDFAVMGTEPYSLEVPLTASSAITVELESGPAGSLTFRVDAPPQPAPVITITSPARHSAGEGAFLEQGDLTPSNVQITGTACHPRYPISELEVAGVTVSVPGTNLCEPFSVAQLSRWGMSVITARARNTRGREGTVVQAYTRGPGHYDIPVAGVLSSSVRGLYSHLTQAALDDGVRTDPDDLATLVKRQFDVQPLVVPASTVVPCNDVFEVTVPQQTPPLSLAINSLTAHATHVAVDITITNPSISILVRADPLQPFDDNCDGTIIENGTFSATSIRVTANLQFGSSVGPTPGISVLLTEPSIVITGASATSTSAAATALLDGLASLSANLLNSYFGQAIVDLLGATVSDLLNGLAPTAAPEVQLNGATIRVASGFSSVVNGGASPNGFVRIGLYGLVSPVTQLPGAVAPRGPLRAWCQALGPSCVGGTQLPSFTAGAYTFGVAMHQDMLNHALWSAWRAGAFTLSGPTLSLNATMPPVSMATAAGDPMGELVWGDLRVTATFDPVDLGQPPGEPIIVESWVSATVRGTVGFDNDTRQLVLTDATSTIDVQLIGPTPPFDNAALRAAIADEVRAPLTALTRAGLGVVPLPQGDPRLVNANVTRSGFFYVLTGSLQ